MTSTGIMLVCDAAAMGRISESHEEVVAVVPGCAQSLMLYGSDREERIRPLLVDACRSGRGHLPRRLGRRSIPLAREWQRSRSPRMVGGPDRASTRVLDALPYRTALAARLMALTSTTSPSYADLQGIAGRLFARFTDPSKQQTMLAVMRPDGSDRRVFLDPNALDPSGSTAID